MKNYYSSVMGKYFYKCISYDDLYLDENIHNKYQRATVARRCIETGVVHQRMTVTREIIYIADRLVYLKKKLIN